MTNKTINITGSIINKRNKTGIPDLKIQAWDKDLLFDDFLGETATDEGGNFKITFTEKRFKEFFFDQKPDIYFKVFKGDKLIHNTIDSVLWNMDMSRKKVEIIIDIKSTDDPRDELAETDLQSTPNKKKITYKDWQHHPEIIEFKPLKRARHAIWQHMATKHEGKVLYWKLWNFWVRAGVEADLRANLFFRDYERANSQSDALLRDVGFPWAKAETEEEVWERIAMVWNWLKDHVRNDGTAYSTITSVPGTWPSILDFAKYYADHGELVWAACFSKAHLFATLLGRIIYPRYRFAVATCHHAENGAPPTASHVYVAVYVSERWFYLDPTAVYSVPFPDYAHRKSIGVSSFTTVDYEHPYKFLPVPLSGFTKVPYLPK